jgi:hypothetical protein
MCLPLQSYLCYYNLIIQNTYRYHALQVPNNSTFDKVEKLSDIDAAISYSYVLYRFCGYSC